MSSPILGESGETILDLEETVIFLKSLRTSKMYHNEQCTRTHVLQLQYVISFEEAATNCCKPAATFVMCPSGALMQWLKLPAWKIRNRGLEPHPGIQVFSPLTRKKSIIVGRLCDRKVAFSDSDRQGSNFASCVWRASSSHSSHHLQEVILAQFSLYMHKLATM